MHLFILVDTVTDKNGRIQLLISSNRDKAAYKGGRRNDSI